MNSSHPPSPDDQRTDAHLMRALAAGDMNALATLAHRHQQAIRAIAYRMTGRWDLADDLTQETFLRLHRSASSYQPTAAFRTFVHRIVVNLALDKARGPRVAGLPDDMVAPDAAGADTPLAHQEKLAAIRDAVAALPERQRMAVILHRFERLNHQQIAEVTGWSASAVESLLVRAYQELRQRLKEWL